MKTSRKLLAASLSCLVAVFTALPCQGAEETPAAASNNFVVALADGSSLVCSPQLKELPLKTSFADINIPIDKLSDVSFDRQSREAAVKLVNGDQLKGTVTLETIKVQTVIGLFTISMEHVERISSKSQLEGTKKKISDSPEKRNMCINNLRMIDGAKEQWALATRRAGGDPVDPAGIAEYLRGSMIPGCPAGGEYKLNPIGRDPQCSVPGHSLHAAHGISPEY